LASTPAFSARRHLFHRVMLLSKEGTMSPFRIAAGSCVLVAALGTGAWGAVHAFPLSTSIVSAHNSVAHDQNLLADRSSAPQTRTTPGQLPAPPPAPPRDRKQVPPPPPPPPPPPTQ